MLFAGTTSESYPGTMAWDGVSPAGGENGDVGAVKYSSEAPSLPRHLDGITLAMPWAFDLVFSIADSRAYQRAR